MLSASYRVAYAVFCNAFIRPVLALAAIPAYHEDPIRTPRAQVAPVVRALPACVCPWLILVAILAGPAGAGQGGRLHPGR